MSYDGFDDIANRYKQKIDRAIDSKIDFIIMKNTILFSIELTGLNLKIVNRLYRVYYKELFDVVDNPSSYIDQK